MELFAYIFSDFMALHGEGRGEIQPGGGRGTQHHGKGRGKSRGGGRSCPTQPTRGGAHLPPQKRRCTRKKGERTSPPLHLSGSKKPTKKKTPKGNKNKRK